MFKISVVTFFVLFSNTSFAKQKFYKWTDAEGVTHYTQENPEDLETSELTISNKKALVKINNSQKEQSKNKIEKETKEGKSYVEQRKERKLKAKQVAQENKEQCKKAQYTIKKYEQKVRMSRIDHDTGEKVFLEDGKRAEIIKKAKQKAKKYC